MASEILPIHEKKTESTTPSLEVDGASIATQRAIDAVLGAKFLKRKYDNLHISPEAQSAKRRTEKRKGQKVSQKPETIIQNYLDRFSDLLNREDANERNQGVEALKQILHKKFIIEAQDIPHRAFELEQELVAQQGYGLVPITEEFKNQKIEQIQCDQKESLNLWIDYLASPDAMYPNWVKYWTFRSMLQMGAYDRESNSFRKRNKKTVHAFPLLNVGALAKTMEYIEISQKGDTPSESNTELQELIKTQNFSKLYAYQLEEFENLEWGDLENIRGYWKKYDQGSQPDALVQSLQGFPLEWCTVNKGTAASQLKLGDFYVYYSEDIDGVAKIPRIAIRMIGKYSISEVRGIERNQNMDSFIHPILDEKLREFGVEGDRYLKRSADMKRMTKINQKHRIGIELTDEDLKFLYEVESNIQNFGYRKDPRIAQIKNQRDFYEDLPRAYGVTPSQMAFKNKFERHKAFEKEYVVYVGDLNLKGIKNTTDKNLPKKIVAGGIRSRLKSAYCFDLSTTVIDRNVSFGNLKSIHVLNFSSARIGGDVFLNSLCSFLHLNLSHAYIGGNLYLSSIRLIDKVDLSSLSIEGEIRLNNVSELNKEQLRRRYPHLAEKIVRTWGY